MVTRPGDLLKEEDGTEFRFAYHPTANRLRLLVPVRASAYSSWSASLTREGASNVLARADGRSHAPPPAPAWRPAHSDDGRYVLTLTLSDDQGAHRDLVRTFVRKHFAWEDEALGCERVVMPPFTSMVVDEPNMRVSCVLAHTRLTEMACGNR